MSRSSVPAKVVTTPWWKKLLLSLVATLVFLLLAEAVVRFADLGPSRWAHPWHLETEDKRAGLDVYPDNPHGAFEIDLRDAEVRAHENAHKAAAGQHARGGPTYEFERGPDGRRYAVGGEVQIDTSPAPNDPDATILKMRQVRRAALAPAEPSPQDRRVASEASQQEAAARQEKLALQREERSGRASDAYRSSSDRATGAVLDVVA